MALNAIGHALRKRRSDEKLSVWHLPELQAAESIAVKAPAFPDDGPIPNRHAGKGVGDDVSPALEWSGVPAGTARLLFVLEDVDVPFRKPIIHTIALLDPVRTSLAEGELNGDVSGIVPVPAAFGRKGYAGPRPVPGHGPHRYRFMVFALDVSFDAPKSFGALAPLVAGHILARGRVTGTYEVGS